MTENELLTFAGIAITAVLGFVGARATARSAKSAATRTAELESFRLQLTSRDELVSAWRADAEAMRKSRDEAEEKASRRVSELESRVDELGDQLDALIEWARTAVSIMHAANLGFPELPTAARARRK